MNSVTETDIQAWKRSLLQLPDAAFLEIARNYLQDVSSPFNKHSLIERLTTFLSREETRKRIVSLLDAGDCELLAVIYVLQQPGFDDILAFYRDERSYIDLHRHLINLEERLLIYRNYESHTPVFLLTPILLPALEQHILARSPLVDFEQIDAPVCFTPWLTDPLITAFLSCVLDYPTFFRNDGSLRKKTSAVLAEKMELLFEETPAGRRIDLLTETLLRAGLVKRENNSLSIDADTWDRISRLCRRSRELTLWSHTLAGVAARQGYQLSDERSIRLLRSLLASLGPTDLLPEEGLRKAVKLIALREGAEAGVADALIKTATALGVLVHESDTGYYKNQYLDTIEEEIRSHIRSAEAPLIVQPNFTIMVKPWAPLTVTLFLPFAASLVKYDLYPQYELTRTSFTNALNYNLSAEETITYLQHGSNDNVPQNLLFSLESWEKEFRSISLYSGVVLTVEQEHQNLIEHSPALSPWIRKILAPGVYLLDPDHEREWSRALAELGFHNISINRDDTPRIQPRWIYEEPAGGGPSESPGSRGPAGAQETPGAPGAGSLSAPASFQENANAPGLELYEPSRLQEELYGQVQNRDLSPEDREEYKARIERRLVIFPEQIHPLHREKGKGEAKGLDFLGKVRLIEQALHKPYSILEVVERQPDGKPKRVYINPTSLTRKSGSLVLTGKTVPHEKTLHLRVDKLSLVRKVKGSLFQP